jgi:hypothetical protein
LLVIPQRITLTTLDMFYVSFARKEAQEIRHAGKINTTDARKFFNFGDIQGKSMKTEAIESSETSASNTQTPEIYPKESILHLEHGESLKSRR